MRACVHACVHAYVRACMFACLCVRVCERERESGLCSDGGKSGVGVWGSGVEGGDGLGEQVARRADLMEHLELMALFAHCK